jgi:uncharacterized protein
MHNYKKNTKLVILQPTSFCNIDCKYCYLPGRNEKDLMAMDILEETIKKLLSSQMLADETKFLWHSGEPLIAGIPFYEKIVKLVDKYNVNKINVTHGIQTNATLINQAWCDFFKKYNFNVGVSLDGPAFLHDNNRITRNGKGTHSRVMQGVSLLKKNNIRLAAICVISIKTLDHAEALFKFFLNNGFVSLSLLIEEIIGENTLTTLHSDQINIGINQRYIHFINDLFQIWLLNKDEITIREFVEVSNSMYKIINNPSYDPKPYETQPLKILTIQKNGDISTFCPELAGGTKENRQLFIIGNIKKINNLEDIIQDKNFLKISKSIEIGTDNCRNSCGHFKFCGGRSPGIKMYETNSFESTVTKHCKFQRQMLVDTVINTLAER